MFTNYMSDESFVSFATGPMSQNALVTSRESGVERQWMECIYELKRLRSLRDDWDGDGAQAPKPEVVDSIEGLFEALRKKAFGPPSRITASVHGNIVIEWQLNGGSYLEAECSEPYRAEWMLEIPGNRIHHWVQEWPSRTDAGWNRAA